ncbi:hypothetical protein EYF80_059459 [Liparis tanakae]|uniref:Uncharacterized protein n=1 Tax=Liparis tanakae TaxID=230148 RepID=A0A4Z2ENR5_9TELE|nr:hypothetical protein EYF80_059459 [Liparis tanakae]
MTQKGRLGVKTHRRPGQEGSSVDRRTGQCGEWLPLQKEKGIKIPEWIAGGLNAVMPKDRLGGSS